MAIIASVVVVAGRSGREGGGGRHAGGRKRVVAVVGSEGALSVAWVGRVGAAAMPPVAGSGLSSSSAVEERGRSSC